MVFYGHIRETANAPKVDATPLHPLQRLTSQYFQDQNNLDFLQMKHPQNVQFPDQPEVLKYPVPPSLPDSITIVDYLKLYCFDQNDTIPDHIIRGWLN